VFGKISGAHLNPAVTIGLLVTKNIDLTDSICYIVAQVIGACLGSLCLFLCLGDPAVAIGGLGATAPGLGVSYYQAMFAEFLGTFFLMMVVMGVAVDKKAEPGFAGISIGMTVAAVIVVLGAFTGASINPARTFGPYLMDMILGGQNLWGLFPIYLVGPILGAICAAFAYAYLAKGSGVCELPQPFNDE
jgi:glycerol uptake facilitator protein